MNQIMKGSKELSLMHQFQSKKPLFTTHFNKPSTIVSGPGIETSNRSNPSTRVRSCNVDLSVSNISQNPSVVGLEHLNDGHEKNGSGSQKPTSNLDEKHQMLCNFFDAMVNSIRLLRLKGVPATLTKLAHNIESLTDRRFTLHHLAQMKYIVPEVIVAKKSRFLDEKTKCMQEDLLLSIEMGIVEIDKNTEVGDGFSQLKTIFRSRVIEFSKTHLEEGIPEGELPQLFHQPKQEPEPNSRYTSKALVASVIAPSFKRRFSSKPLGGQVSESTPVEQSTCFPKTPIKESDSSDEALVCPALTPVKLASIHQKLASTPAEFASTPTRLISATPALRKPKRPLMTEDNADFELTNKSFKRRSLKFDESSVDVEDQLSQMDDDENTITAQGSAIDKDDVLTVLPENLLQSLIEKEKKNIEENDPTVSHIRRRQQIMAGVPKLFDIIRLLFQSVRRNVITKEELIFKLLSSHIDIIDRGEIEEQLKLLQELAPEYISEQISLSGDTIISLNKYLSAELIRARLLEAN